MRRMDKVELSRPLLYDDSVDDVFEREPYSVLVRSLLIGMSIAQTPLGVQWNRNITK